MNDPLTTPEPQIPDDENSDLVAGRDPGWPTDPDVLPPAPVESSDPSESSDPDESDEPVNDEPGVYPDIDRPSPWYCMIDFDQKKQRALTSLQRRPYLERLHRIVSHRLIQQHKALQRGEIRGITHLWTPVQAVCVDLMITTAQLNRLLKEYCGLSATQLYDQIHAEADNIADKIRDEVIAFIDDHFAPGYAREDDLRRELDLEEQRLKFWRAWKDHRTAELGWSNSTWALQHGFSSYARFCRAIYLATGQTPLQIEAQVMREAALYFRAAHSLARRHLASSYPCPNTYDYDHFSQLRSENPEWWTAQRKRYDLFEELHELEKELSQTSAKFRADCCEPFHPLCTRETKIAAEKKEPRT